MATKNIEFTARLNKLIKDSAMAKKDFAAKAGIGYTTLMNYLIPKGVGRVPEWDQLAKIANITHVSIDWLLTGKNSFSGSDDRVFAERHQYGQNEDSDSPEIKIACHQLREIMDSNHPGIRSALLSNLAEFHGSIEKERSKDEEIRDLNRRLQKIEERDRAKQCTGTDEAASSNTGKSAM